MYSTIFVSVYGLLAIFFFLDLFEVVESPIYTPLFNCLAIFEMIFVLGALTVMLYFGSKINREYICHKNSVLDIKHALFFIKEHPKGILGDTDKFQGV
jgi:hypothetical protein